MKKGKKVLMGVLGIIILILVVWFVFPTWTKKIKSNDSISEMKSININGEKQTIIIRGENKDNPVIVYVHGGPGCSEIPLMKYEKEWEENFTIVNYDQRGCGKSSSLFRNYDNVTSDKLVDDLLEIVRYIKIELGKDNVILMGHSYGTYIGMKAISREPDLFSSYIGIGQMADIIKGEIDNYNFCLNAASNAGNEEDILNLEKIQTDVSSGKTIVPRSYVNKYGGGSRGFDANSETIKGMIFGSEYNFKDIMKYLKGTGQYQERLINEAIDNPLPNIVKEVEIPCYFVMGKYDAMTSPIQAKLYLDELVAPEKGLIVFHESAHYPQFEEQDKFIEFIDVNFCE